MSLQKKFNDNEMFVFSWLICREVDIEPFNLDKIIFSGEKFMKHEFSLIFSKYKIVYQSAGKNSLIGQIVKYK